MLEIKKWIVWIESRFCIFDRIFNFWIDFHQLEKIPDGSILFFVFAVRHSYQEWMSLFLFLNKNGKIGNRKKHNSKKHEVINCKKIFADLSKYSLISLDAQSEIAHKLHDAACSSK